MAAVNDEDQPRITAAELAEVITKHPDWADLPVHMLNMTDDAVWLTEVGYDCFDVNEGPVLSLLAHAPAVPGGEPAPSYGVVLARAEAAERRVDELLADAEHMRALNRDVAKQAMRAMNRASAAEDRLVEATTLLGYFVDHEDQPCRLDHHGACQEHSGSSLRRCDVAAGRELLGRIRGGRADD